MKFVLWLEPERVSPDSQIAKEHPAWVLHAGPGDGLFDLGHPEARATFFTDRNRNWVKQIDAMLRERKTFFITVGAGHLVGKDGIPAMLRADGYKVDGP